MNRLGIPDKYIGTPTKNLRLVAKAAEVGGRILTPGDGGMVSGKPAFLKIRRDLYALRDGWEYSPEYFMPRGHKAEMNRAMAEYLTTAADLLRLHDGVRVANSFDPGFRETYDDSAHESLRTGHDPYTLHTVYVPHRPGGHFKVSLSFDRLTPAPVVNAYFDRFNGDIEGALQDEYENEPIIKEKTAIIWDLLGNKYRAGQLGESAA